MIESWIYPVMFVATILGALGSLLMKLGVKKSMGIKDLLNKMLIIGLVAFAMSALLVIVALKFADLAKVFPMTALTYIWVAILSSRILKENMRAEKIAAFILIIVGIIFVSV